MVLGRELCPSGYRSEAADALAEFGENFTIGDAAAFSGEDGGSQGFELRLLLAAIEFLKQVVGCGDEIIVGGKVVGLSGGAAHGLQFSAIVVSVDLQRLFRRGPTGRGKRGRDGYPGLAPWAIFLASLREAGMGEFCSFPGLRRQTRSARVPMDGFVVSHPFRRKREKDGAPAIGKLLRAVHSPIQIGNFDL